MLVVQAVNAVCVAVLPPSQMVFFQIKIKIPDFELVARRRLVAAEMSSGGEAAVDSVQVFSSLLIKRNAFLIMIVTNFDRFTN